LSTYSRTHPYLATITHRHRLNKSGSTKETFHLELEVDNFPFTVGDSVGVLPQNDPLLIQSILAALHADGSEPVFDARSNTNLSFFDFLQNKANLCKCTSSLLKLFTSRGHPAPEHPLQNYHLIDLLHLYPSNHPTSQEMATVLLPLMPRFYSIASSPLMFPNQIHLTVASLTYSVLGQTRLGVGSHFLCQLAKPHATPIPLYVQTSNGFTLPSDSHASIILIGPGTGIAPFRAFLQERSALQHPGRNWLFFGERNRATDFYYDDYFLELERQSRLRLDLAFSRDQAEKCYVQHRLWENRASLYDWIQSGAYLYVCGDAEQMARDVELTLLRIGRDVGNLTEDEGRQWLKSLRQQKRYLLDVY
jgi:sulfite reductase (NADPH) flavoprotein alpha-component